jgi:hypothetical protein
MYFKKSSRTYLYILGVICIGIYFGTLQTQQYVEKFDDLIPTSDKQLESTATYDCEQYKAPASYKYDLALLLTTKNDSSILEEYIKHYIWQGVEHFYIIDNGSEDNTKEMLSGYINNGLVSYYYYPEKYKQIENYNKVYHLEARRDTKWLIVCDSDEYIYNRFKGFTIRNYLDGLDYNEVCAVTIPWKVFGSSGHSTQPWSIRTAFLWRKKDVGELSKSIVNTSLTCELNIHYGYYVPNTKIIESPNELALNHYAIMSKEYYIYVKMPRGSAARNNFRNLTYFNQYDFKEYYDEELKNLLLAKDVDNLAKDVFDRPAANFLIL